MYKFEIISGKVLAIIQLNGQDPAGMFTDVCLLLWRIMVLY